MFTKRAKVNRRIDPSVERSGWRARLNVRAVALSAMALTVCGLAIWGAMVLNDPRTLPIATVKIEGEFRHLGKAQVQQALAGHVAGGFFNADVEAARAAVLRLPWVNTATVRRVWTDTLEVAVVEQVPLARWGTGGLVNSQGSLFFPSPDSYPVGLVQLQGPQGSETTVAARYRDMNQSLRAIGLRINRVALDDRRAWHIELDNGATLVLGRAADDTRLKRFARLYPAALAARAADIREVDLRYPNGFAVRWKKV